MSNRFILAVGGVAAVLIIVLAVILIAVAGGGGDGDDEATGDRSPTASETEAGDDDDGGEAASGELRIRGSDPLFLDPAVAQDAGSAFYIVEIFSGLVRLDRDLHLQPDLAERWETSPDGLTYTFHLNENATFHDGRLVTADDVKYSIERALHPSTGSIVAESFLGDIVGARDVSRGRAEEVSGVRVINDTTLEITIDAPKSYFLYKLTYPTGFVVDRRQVEANPQRWTRRPNGTGPYQLQEWSLAERIVLEAYEKHHLGPPKLKTVRIELSGGSALVAYEDGEIDITGVGFDDLERIQDPANDLNDEYQTTTQQSLDYIGFNTNAPPFDDPLVRQAFAMAIDREVIAEVVLRGAIPVANGILMPGLPGYTEEDKTYEFNPERARDLLAQSEYADNMPEITLAETGAGATVGEYTEAILQMWRENLDVQVNVQQAEPGTFFRDIDEGRYQMFHIGWIMDYPDPEDILDVLFHSESRQNNTRYSNPEVDALLEQARVEQDTERRLEMYQDIERRLIEDAVWIPMFFDRTHFLVKPYVQNFELPPLVIERFRDVVVER